jgi:hypothetical protein
MARSGDQLVEGKISDVIAVQAVDRRPPAVPSGLMAVAADPGGFITWNSNEERDFAGYNVFRGSSPRGPFTRINPALHTANALFDPDYKAGLYYAVSAVDEFGNESDRSQPFRVL